MWHWSLIWHGTFEIWPLKSRVPSVRAGFQFWLFTPECCSHNCKRLMAGSPLKIRRWSVTRSRLAAWLNARMMGGCADLQRPYIKGKSYMCASLERGRAEGIVLFQGHSVSGCKLLQLDSTPTRFLCNPKHSSLCSLRSAHMPWRSWCDTRRQWQSGHVSSCGETTLFLGAKNKTMRFDKIPLHLQLWGPSCQGMHAFWSKICHCAFLKRRGKQSGRGLIKSRRRERRGCAVGVPWEHLRLKEHRKNIVFPASHPSLSADYTKRLTLTGAERFNRSFYMELKRQDNYRISVGDLLLH